MKNFAFSEPNASRKVKRASLLLPDVPEAMGILFLLGIFVTIFGQLLSGYLDALVILLIVGVCFLRDGTLRISAPILIASGLSAAYGALWLLSCSPVTCSGQVEAVGTTGWQFAIYLFLFAILAVHGMIKITSKVIVFFIFGFYAFLAATGQFTLFDSLDALGTAKFHTSYRFGSGNEINTINFSALFFATLVPFAFPRTPRDYIGYFAMLLIALFVVATYSRGGLLLFGILLVISGIVLWRLTLLNALFIIFLALCGFAFLTMLGYFEHRAFDLETDHSFAIRMRAYELLSEVELFGNKAALRQHFLRGGAIDNALVRHIVGAGITVVLLVIAIGPAIQRSFRYWFRGDDLTRSAIALFGWVIAMLADDTFFSIWGAFLISFFVVPPITQVHIRRRPLRESQALSLER